MLLRAYRTRASPTKLSAVAVAVGVSPPSVGVSVAVGVAVPVGVLVAVSVTVGVSCGVGLGPSHSSRAWMLLRLWSVPAERSLSQATATRP